MGSERGAVLLWQYFVICWDAGSQQLKADGGDGFLSLVLAEGGTDLKCNPSRTVKKSWNFSN